MIRGSPAPPLPSAAPVPAPPSNFNFLTAPQSPFPPGALDASTSVLTVLRLLTLASDTTFHHVCARWWLRQQVLGRASELCKYMSQGTVLDI